ncbi:NADP transhydrogenase subunit alpha [Psychrobacter sp. P11G5]|nr:NADP transhydrogenase subunit alpha [Psychrobacter sp. P11G5]
MNNDNRAGLNTEPKIAIIGGGLTGLFTATLLERAFLKQQTKSTVNSLAPQITIFEKSRSVGRLATRYRTDSKTNKNWQWAFGAQFFTVKTSSFQQFIAPWLNSELLQPWCAQVVSLTPANVHIQDAQAQDANSPNIERKEQWDTTHARYISTPKMTSWGRVLADNLQHTTIKFKTRVAPINKVQMDSVQDNKAIKTELFDETGSSLGWFDWIICTAPNGQAVELMADSGFTEQAKITEPQMLACYTLMLGWDNLEQLPKTLSNDIQSAWDVAYVNASILDRIFIEHQKPAHDDLLPSVTIHARNDWSEEHVDDDIETVKAQLLAAAQQALNWHNDHAPSQIDCHRWRYAATVIDVKNRSTNEALGILIDTQHQWIASGDWCGQGNIESCYQVAKETVKVLCAS